MKLFQRLKSIYLNGTPYSRKDWVALNLARLKVGKTRDYLLTSAECSCSEPTQTMDHILRECPQALHATTKTTRNANDNAFTWIRQWRNKIWWSFWYDGIFAGKCSGQVCLALANWLKNIFGWIHIVFFAILFSRSELDIFTQTVMTSDQIKQRRMTV